jgi:toluene monooxygenase system ferredoxin subunit
MCSWVRVASLDDLWEGEMMSVSLNSTQIVLCHVADGVYAYADRCPHQATPLSEGKLEDHLLTCRAHEWVFDVRSGRGVNPANACLYPFLVKLDGDSIRIDLHGVHT